MQRISLIAAMSENRVIGNHNHLPWHLPDDWKNFREVTNGKPFIMGRKSYQAEDALISDYRNIIVTSKKELDLCEHCELAETLVEAFAKLASEPEVFVLGGGSIFEQTINKANYLYLTIVHHTFSGDAFFPPINWNQWTKVKEDYHEADERHAFAFSLNEYERKADQSVLPGNSSNSSHFFLSFPYLSVMKKTLWLYLLCALFSTSLLSQTTYTPETVPDPKQSGGGYVSDPANYLKPGEVQQLNQMIGALEGNSTAQVAIVILPSIGQEVPKDFATRLFQQWGIGQAGNDNGLLLLVVMDQRRTEFETGYGMEAVLPDIICYRILMEELIPQFQDGNYGAGVVAAISRVKTLLENPEVLEEIRAEAEPKYYPFFGLKIPPWIYWYLVGALLFGLAVVVWIAITLANKEELYDKYRHVRYASSFIFIILFPIPYLLLYFVVQMVLRRLRNQTRYSKINGQPMRKLTEKEEDEYLDKGQIAEEMVGSVDYDVWITEDLEDIVILPYKKRFTKYSACPKCNFRTYHHAQTHTLRQATQYSTGEKERLYECKNCNYTHRKRITIPRISSGGGSGGGGFSGGGGGGWGGGSSGGGGGGASW